MNFIRTSRSGYINCFAQQSPENKRNKLLIMNFINKKEATKYF